MDRIDARALEHMDPYLDLLAISRVFHLIGSSSLLSLFFFPLYRLFPFKLFVRFEIIFKSFLIFVCLSKRETTNIMNVRGAIKVLVEHDTSAYSNLPLHDDTTIGDLLELMCEKRGLDSKEWQLEFEDEQYAYI